MTDQVASSSRASWRLALRFATWPSFGPNCKTLVQRLGTRRIDYAAGSTAPGIGRARRAREDDSITEMLAYPQPTGATSRPRPAGYNLALATSAGSRRLG